MDKNDVKGNEDFNFLNEHIVEKRKWNITKICGFTVFCLVLFILLGCVGIFWKDSFRKEEYESKSYSVSSEDDGNQEPETTTHQISGIEDITYGVVMLSVNEDEETEGNLNDIGSFFSGLILEAGNDIKILTFYDYVKDKEDISVYINEKKCIGKIYSVSEEYGIAVISVNASSANLDKDDFEYIKCADIKLNKEIPYAIGDDVIFVGNSYSKEKLVITGSLTSMENMYNIVDMELETMNTSILSSYINNGFIFDSQGKAVGMVNPAFNKNVTEEYNISAVSFRRISKCIEKLIRGNEISYMGIYGRKVTDDVIEIIDKDMPYGIYISNTEDDSPAYVAGILKGDILVKFEGRKVVDFDEFSLYLQECDISDEVVVTVMRKGKDGYKEINYIIKIGGR